MFTQDTSIYTLNTLLDCVGSFWGAQLHDKLVYGYFTAILQQYAQAYSDYIEILNSIGRETCPVYHKQNWALLTITRSSVVSSSGSNTYKYGANITYGSGYYYGQRNNESNVVSGPPTLEHAAVVTDKIINPSIALVVGKDFTVLPDTDEISFNADPFTTFTAYPVYDDLGNIVDEVVVVWLGSALFDSEALYENWGYLLSNKKRSSQFYKDFINSSFNAIVGVASIADVTRLLSAAMGVATANGTETVEDIAYQDTKRLIITDKSVYVFDRLANPVVSVGDTITYGQSLVDVVEVVEVNAPSVVDELIANPSKWPALAVVTDNGLFTFENKASNVTWVDGDAKFDVVGDNIDEFWTAVRAGEFSLAEVLDVRENKVGAPAAVNMPATANPMRVLLKDILNSNALLVRVRPHILDSQYFISVCGILRQHITPSVNVFMVASLDSNSDAVPQVAVTNNDWFPTVNGVVEDTYVKTISDKCTIFTVEGCP